MVDPAATVVRRPSLALIVERLSLVEELPKHLPQEVQADCGGKWVPQEQLNPFSSRQLLECLRGSTQMVCKAETNEF